MIVKFKVVPEPLSQLKNALVVIEVDVLIFDVSPEPFYKYIVRRPAPAIHANEYFAIQQPLCKDRAGKECELNNFPNSRYSKEQPCNSNSVENRQI
jgi:hypothetical protein